MEPREPPDHDVPPRWLPVVHELSERVGHDDPDARATFERLADPAFYRDVASAQLAALARDPAHALPRARANGGRWVLYSDRHLTLAMGLVEEPDGAGVDSLTCDTSLAVVAGGRLRLERYRTTAAADRRDVFDPDALLAPAGEVELAPGGAVHLEADLDVVRIVGFTPGVAVLAMTVHRTASRLRWHFDTTTRRPIACSYADSTSSQIKFLLAMIESQGRADHLPFVHEALALPSHAVRWAAARTLWALDAGPALAATRALLDDPHPHVRRAAAATLHLFESRPTEDADAARSQL